MKVETAGRRLASSTESSPRALFYAHSLTRETARSPHASTLGGDVNA